MMGGRQKRLAKQKAAARKQRLDRVKAKMKATTRAVDSHATFTDVARRNDANGDKVSADVRSLFSRAMDRRMTRPAKDIRSGSAAGHALAEAIDSVNLLQLLLQQSVIPMGMLQSPANYMARGPFTMRDEACVMSSELAERLSKLHRPRQDPPPHNIQPVMGGHAMTLPGGRYIEVVGTTWNDRPVYVYRDTRYGEPGRVVSTEFVAVAFMAERMLPSVVARKVHLLFCWIRVEPGLHWDRFPMFLKLQTRDRVEDTSMTVEAISPQRLFVILAVDCEIARYRELYIRDDDASPAVVVVEGVGYQYLCDLGDHERTWQDIPYVRDTMCKDLKGGDL